ncbi:four helix bundle protein [Pedobacter aquatilis]|uniref:four helix bundle protein n=1 Tax=Pedobacter aquatilis TaxID=351343 RepID=UPI00292DFFA7|nr:four helix bundle protein [Pedobacter aquatilis]
MHNFRELKVWKMGIEVSKSVFQITRTFPSEEKYSLTSQITRCAISIPSNIAEGCGRKSNKELNQFLSISLGSAFELETQIIIAFEFGYIDKIIYDETIIQINEIQKMISGLQKSLGI